jgi:hypothetical protein
MRVRTSHAWISQQPETIKETDPRARFTDVLKSPTAYETLERSVLQPAPSRGGLRMPPSRWKPGR